MLLDGVFSFLVHIQLYRKVCSSEDAEGGTAMITSRLTGAFLALFCIAVSNGVAAEEVGPGACPVAATGFADPMTAPHWNGWGVDGSQHRFQPTEMAQLTAGDVPRLKLK